MSLLNYRLPEIMSGEKVIKVARHSFFIFFEKIFFVIILGLLPLIILFFINSNKIDLITNAVLYPLIILLTSAYALFLILFIFFCFLDYYLDIFVITNKRIINVNHEGFFSRSVSEQRIERIQDASTEIKGIWPTLFNFGDITIQTAGEINKIYFKDIARVEEVRDLIIKIIKETHIK